MDHGGNQTVLGNYILETVIGRGGMGTVYRARHRLLGHTVAVKVIHPHLVHDPTARDRFLREATVAASLRHPNTVRVFDFGAETERVFLVMDYLHGEPLNTRLAAGRLPTVQAMHILQQVASAVDYLHRQGYVHRDIKPANVIVDHALNATIVDFGIARALDGGLLTSGDVISGTPFYLAPEVYQGERPGPAADNWALAVVAFELLTGQRPFLAENQPQLIHAVTRGEPRRATSLRPELPREIDVVFERQLAKRPSDRYPSAESFLLALQSALRGQIIRPVARPSPSPSQAERTLPVNVGQSSAPSPAHLSAADVIVPGDPARAVPATPPRSPRFGCIIAGAAIGLGAFALLVCLGLGGVYLATSVAQINATATAEADATGTARAVAAGTSTAVARVTATAEARAARVGATATAAAAGATRRFGPVSGSFAHEEDGFLELRAAGQSLVSFIVEASFTNPFSPSERIFDYGFTFRDTGPNQQYRIMFYPSAARGGAFRFILVEGDPNNSRPVSCVDPTNETPVTSQGIGSVSGSVFRNGEGEQNTLRLVVRGPVGWVWVNDTLIARCAVDAKLAAGDVQAGIGFTNDRELNGRFTTYEGFTVWALP
ncbi:MAG: hypothetical protein KatS3mg060_1470 [Dehalococcoidia bacterium]|nr:MAG: hypothetical protein KatS3mg060_1470 [Dehalococcoidia bacterium]